MAAAHVQRRFAGDKDGPASTQDAFIQARLCQDWEKGRDATSPFTRVGASCPQTCGFFGSSGIFCELLSRRTTRPSNPVCFVWVSCGQQQDRSSGERQTS